MRPRMGFFRDSKRNCHVQNNDRPEGRRQRLHEGPSHTSLPLLALPLSPRPEGLPLSTALGGDPASLLRDLSHQTPRLGPHVLDGQQGSNGNRIGTKSSVCCSRSSMNRSSRGC